MLDVLQKINRDQENLKGEGDYSSVSLPFSLAGPPNVSLTLIPLFMFGPILVRTWNRE